MLTSEPACNCMLDHIFLQRLTQRKMVNCSKTWKIEEQVYRAANGGAENARVENAGVKKELG